MCVSAVVFGKSPQGRRCETIGQLAKALGLRVAAVPMKDHPPYAPIRPRWNECLCSVDAKALAEQVGMRFEDVSYDTDTDHYDAWALRARQAGSDG